MTNPNQDNRKYLYPRCILNNFLFEMKIKKIEFLYGEDYDISNLTVWDDSGSDCIKMYHKENPFGVYVRVGENLYGKLEDSCLIVKSTDDIYVHPNPCELFKSTEYNKLINGHIAKTIDISGDNLHGFNDKEIKYNIKDNMLFNGIEFRSKIPDKCKKIEFLYGDVKGDIEVGNGLYAIYDGEVMTIQSPNIIYAHPDSSYMFSKLISDFDFTNFNTSYAENMSSMFAHTSTSSLDISGFDFRNVKIMNSMFSWFDSYKPLNLVNLNTENVVDMSYMFMFCETELNINNWNTENVICMDDMFFGAIEQELNLSSFNVSNVMSMYEIFEEMRIRGDKLVLTEGTPEEIVIRTEEYKLYDEDGLYYFLLNDGNKVY